MLDWLYLLLAVFSIVAYFYGAIIVALKLYREPFSQVNLIFALCVLVLLANGLDNLFRVQSAWAVMEGFLNGLLVVVLKKWGDPLIEAALSSRLLTQVWERSISGKLLLEKELNDLRIVKINPEGARINPFLKVGGLLGVTMPGHLNAPYPYALPLLDIYLECLNGGEAKRLEFRYDDAPFGWYVVNATPINKTLLFLDFMDITSLKQAAVKDKLTGLYNRHYLEESKSQNWGGCLYLDLDRFKTINDSRGHHLGDQVLVAVGYTLARQAALVRGTAVRWGGDEFLVLVPQSQIESINMLAINILCLINEIDIDGATVSASIGVAVEGDELKTLGQLEQAAEIASREAKKDRSSDRPGKRIRYWNANLSKEHKRRASVEMHLHHPQSQGEFSLAYQPIYSLKTGELVSAEALIRWESKYLGWVPPGEFIPIAETTGQIFQISDWVIENSLAVLSKWTSLSPNFSLSINISPAELDEAGFCERLQERINLAGLERTSLGLEITERGISRNLDKYMEVLKTLRQATIRIKLDDFGIGQSGLLHLLQCQFDEVKVDRELIPANRQDSDRISICAAIASMAGHLNFKLVAEGIETEEQLQLMSELGYDYGQGYYLSKPTQDWQITKLLEKLDG